MIMRHVGMVFAFGQMGTSLSFNRRKDRHLDKEGDLMFIGARVISKAK